MTQGLENHWSTQTTDKYWNFHKMYQKNEAGYYITKGSYFTIKTKKYSLQKTKDLSGALFPAKSHLGALVSNFGYIAATVPHRLFTALGSSILALRQTASAVQEIYRARNKEGFSLKKTFQPVCKRYLIAIRNVTPLALSHLFLNHSILGCNLLSMAVKTSILLSIGYAIYNPLGMRVYVDELEKTLNAEPLNDSQLQHLTLRQKFEHIADGTYSLSRLFDLHKLGTFNERIEKENKFVKIN